MAPLARIHRSHSTGLAILTGQCSPEPQALTALRMVADLYHAGISLKAAGLHMKHQDWPQERLLFEARRSLLFAGT